MDRVDNEAVRTTASSATALANAGRARQAGWLRALEQALLEMRPGGGDARDAADARQPGPVPRSGSADAPRAARMEVASSAAVDARVPAARALPAGTTAHPGAVQGRHASSGPIDRAADASGPDPQERVEQAGRMLAQPAVGMPVAARVPARVAAAPGAFPYGVAEPARPGGALQQPPTSAVPQPQMPREAPVPALVAQPAAPATEARTAPRENTGRLTPQHLFLERTEDGLVAWIRDAFATPAQLAGLVQALRAQAAQLGLRVHSVRLNGEPLDEPSTLAAPGDPTVPDRDPSNLNPFIRRSEPHGD